MVVVLVTVFALAVVPARAQAPPPGPAAAPGTGVTLPATVDLPTAPTAVTLPPLLDARGLEVVRAPAVLRPDRSAIGAQALVLRARGAARGIVRDVAARRLLVRVRRGACAAAPTLVVRVDGRRVLSRVVRRRTWQTLRAPVRLDGGDHRVAVAVGGERARCPRELRIDRLELRAAPRRVPVGSALRWSAISDDRYRETFLREFDSLTPENEMKFNALRPRQSAFSFSTADQMVDFAQRTGKAVRGHFLIGGWQLPQWLTSRPWTRDALLRVLRDHVATVVGRYRGRVAEWDVVNEPLNEDGTLGRHLWASVIGPDYIEHALRAAHDADPDAKLFINEAGAELESPRFDALLEMARDLRARGVPLHGIGLEDHVHLMHFPSRAALARRLRAIGALGLEAQITEMDVSVTPLVAPPLLRLARQAEVYAESAAACNEVAACTRFTVWGVDDAHSWIGEDKRGLLFDSGYAPKPALDAVRSAFAPRGG